MAGYFSDILILCSISLIEMVSSSPFFLLPLVQKCLIRSKYLFVSLDARHLLLLIQVLETIVVLLCPWIFCCEERVDFPLLLEVT